MDSKRRDTHQRLDDHEVGRPAAAGRGHRCPPSKVRCFSCSWMWPSTSWRPSPSRALPHTSISSIGIQASPSMFRRAKEMVDHDDGQDIHTRFDFRNPPESAGARRMHGSTVEPRTGMPKYCRVSTADASRKPMATLPSPRLRKRHPGRAALEQCLARRPHPRLLERVAEGQARIQFIMSPIVLASPRLSLLAPIRPTCAVARWPTGCKSWTKDIMDREVSGSPGTQSLGG